MGWEYRGSNRYFYKARRVGRRVVKEYVGGGRVAELSAQLHGYEKQIARLAATEYLLDRIGREADAAFAVEFDALCGRAIGRWLTALGFHRHHRGAWRRRRGFRGVKPVQLTRRAPFDEWNTDTLKAAGGFPPKDLLDRAAEGDAEVLPALERHLDENPACVPLFGDIGRQALVRVIRAVANGNLTFERAMLRQAGALRRRLAGEAPSAPEVLLAERATMRWLTLSVHGASYNAEPRQGMPYKEHVFHKKRIGGANRRLQSTLRTLATVRRLRLPDLLTVVHVGGEPDLRRSAAPREMAELIPVDT